ncbi:SAM-dependent methyltransferase [Methyloradius palustris]|uniref:Cyclopropane-fatty-acyl-phospholipid synthase n=1 Tax=Methyloradius palustris TaxID=2778876 RepID=A0A8D5GEH0_9PROT|nr:cyclopropane-fatty-acyl-phospholipid synthase family protein [Methyloradius palustris]BCM25209.1 cyclopropane-fatty-acyl-phospholipid synthase [Methyloradius palustris]
MLDEFLQQQIQQKIKDFPVSIHWGTHSIIPSTTSKVAINVRNPRALMTLAHPTLGGLARAYVEEWLDFEGSAQDIMSLGQAYCNIDAGKDAQSSDAWMWWRHTRNRDRKNISYHYDVSNDFYNLWLDEAKVYSCAYYENGTEHIDQAQAKKLDHICRKLMLKPGERFLDIGCGWGALMLKAAEEYGVEAWGITLSQNQYDYVVEQIAKRGLGGRAHVQLMDYRDLPAELPFDKIASVGMFEHVGKRNLREYFDKIYSLLKPDGLVMNHGITFVELNSGGLGSGISDFIEDYVFPGGELTHISTVTEELSAAGLEPLDIENMRIHYGKTLWEWVTRLEANKTEAIRLIGEKNYRIWRIYMAGSAFSFDHNWLALFQVVAGKSKENGSLAYPFNRNHIYQ